MAVSKKGEGCRRQVYGIVLNLNTTPTIPLPSIFYAFNEQFTVAGEEREKKGGRKKGL